MKTGLAAVVAVILAVAPVLAQEAVSSAAGAVLRGLDKLNGQVVDIELANGETAMLGRLQIRLGECRYPEGNPTGDAFAYLSIHEEGTEEAAFSGWMVASSPALSALDHPRYDVWVMRCITR